MTGCDVVLGCEASCECSIAAQLNKQSSVCAVGSLLARKVFTSLSEPIPIKSLIRFSFQYILSLPATWALRRALLVQVGALKLYTEQIWPDMVARHLPSSSGASRRGETATLHSHTAKQLSKRLPEIMGPDGSKLKKANLRCGAL